MRRAWMVGLLLVSLPACASLPPRPPVFPTEALIRADGLLSEGCYECLIEARDVFRQLAVGPYRAHVLPSLFETELLLILRRQELAMDRTEALAAARQTALELPDEAFASRYLSLVERVSEDTEGATERDLQAFRQAHRGFISEVVAEAEWVEQGPLGARLGGYLAIALRCTWQPVAPRPLDATPLVPPDEAPIVTYRRAICSEVPNVIELEVVRALVPRFHEAHFYLARGWRANIARFGFAKITDAMRDVVPRFTESPSVLFTAAVVEQSLRRYDEALQLYARTLALRPNHESALLGRTECQSRLKRHQDAIAEATALIRLGGQHLAMAHYWRAWNHHTLGNLGLAREDIDAAKKALRQLDSNIPLLAGVIEHDQDDLDPATRDLRLARNLSAGRACLAFSYLALVSVKRGDWSEAATGFQDAMECYVLSLTAGRAQRDSVEAADDIAADFKAMRLAEIVAKIQEDETLRHVAAMNAAKAFANIGNYAAAVRLGTIAQEDPSLAAEVQVLRNFLIDSKAPVRLPDVGPPATQ